MGKAWIETATRYNNTEREALEILRALEESRWLVFGAKYPVLVHTDHQALVTALRGEPPGRIAGWQSRFKELDLKYLHVPEQIMS